MKKIVTVVGARPQFVKAAAVSRALAGAPDLTEILVHTGQHADRDMSAVFFEELAIPEPAHHLGIHGGPHGEITGRMMVALERVLAAERPDMVLVYGDTNSTLAGALAAAKLQMPVAHVEAGLRSFNRRMPEEINRVLVDRVAALLFCPTSTAVTNLAREGIDQGVHQVGDVMLDAALFAARNPATPSRILERLGLSDGAYRLATVHRAENTDDPRHLGSILDYLRAKAGEKPMVFPVHPRTRAALARFGLGLDGLEACEPLGYLDMARLLKGATTLYTDSGGLQKEAYFARVPCVTLRDETEWVETVDAGWNRLWTVPDFAPRRDIEDYGGGDAAAKVVARIQAYLTA